MVTEQPDDVTTMLSHASQEYLAARERFHNGSGVKYLREFREATDRLWAAFSESMSGLPLHVITEAFHDYRRLLVTHHAHVHPWRGNQNEFGVQ